MLKHILSTTLSLKQFGFKVKGYIVSLPLGGIYNLGRMAILAERFFHQILYNETESNIQKEKNFQKTMTENKQSENFVPTTQKRTQIT